MQARRAAGDLTTPSLAARLKERIAREGPISVADYMEACLADANAGYYRSRQPIGAEGDFITAPEISQIFGELIGVWAAAVWQSMGEPKSLIVAELGPGRGTLMADALRAWESVPGFFGSASIALIETSPVLRDAQRETLRAVAAPLDWHERIEDVAEGPLILIANEFLDALPIRQFVRRGDHWLERCVTVDQGGAFAFTEMETAASPSTSLKGKVADGAICEDRPAVELLVSELASRAERAPLAALFIDYGHEESGLGDTLQAMRKHRYADPLASPGEADLTAHVDFAALRRAADTHRLTAWGPLPQGEFLLKLGLGLRRDRLLEQAREGQKTLLASGAARLVDPQQMGTLFKAMALTSEGLLPPPPFAGT
jgi:NADH dehydrogenase [ubiquinone] 1 alpha subcomplex assembly factor 7